MKTTIYFIRHGDVYNPDGIIYGRLPDFTLSEKGKKEIEQTANFFKNKNVDELFSSPLRRTEESAAIVQKELGLQTLHTSDLLIEVKTGYQGGKFDSLDSLQSEVYFNPHDPTDETIEQLAKRMLTFVNQTVNKYTGEHIIAVGHGDPIMALKTLIQYNSYDFYLFKTDHYIAHGEVFEVISENTRLQIKSIFKPRR